MKNWEEGNKLRKLAMIMDELFNEREAIFELLTTLAAIIPPNHYNEISRLNWMLQKLSEEPRREG